MKNKCLLDALYFLYKENLFDFFPKEKYYEIYKNGNINLIKFIEYIDDTKLKKFFIIPFTVLDENTLNVFKNKYGNDKSKVILLSYTYTTGHAQFLHNGKFKDADEKEFKINNKKYIKYIIIVMEI